jgi:hypothetical protein
MHAREKDSLGSWRKRALGMLRELKRRWAPVTEQLRSFQTDAIAKVTAKRDLGLTALLLVMAQWGDTCYPYGLITGLPAVFRLNQEVSLLWQRWWQTQMITIALSLPSFDQACMMIFFYRRAWWMRTRDSALIP